MFHQQLLDPLLVLDAAPHAPAAQCPMHGCWERVPQHLMGGPLLMMVAPALLWGCWVWHCTERLLHGGDPVGGCGWVHTLSMMTWGYTTTGAYTLTKHQRTDDARNSWLYYYLQ